jgi:hypothetical protein
LIFTKAAALELCALNEAAYDLANTGHATLPAGFAAPVAIRMPAAPRPFLLRHDPLDIWGFATGKGPDIYLVFRGTQITSGLDFLQEWAEDALSLPLAPFGAGRVHPGFYDAWRALRQPVLDALLSLSGTLAEIEAVVSAGTGRLIITGHSLGAAIATLCRAEIAGDLMTFGCPRVGNPAFAESLWTGQTVRVINAHDIVPDVPTDPPFRHGGAVRSLRGTWSAIDVKLAHALGSYAAGLEGLQEGA